jgi:hypothetical protein
LRKLLSGLWPAPRPPSKIVYVPLTIFDVKGIPAVRRERIEAAVSAGGNQASGSYEAWISVDPLNSAVVVVITGPFGFERRLQFPLDAEAYEITERVRATLEE